MPNTTYLGLPYPALSNAPNVPQDMQNLAAGLDGKLSGVILCTSSTRPAAVRDGAVIYETDTDSFAYHNGTAWQYFAGARRSHTPVLTAATTNPTLGTGAQQSGWWTYLPGCVQFTFFVKFGTSGAAAGSGNYAISLPVPAAAPFGTSVHSAVGSIQAADSSPTTLKVGTAFVPGNALSTIAMIAEGGVIVGSGSPWTWAAGDYLSGSIVYPV